MEPILSYPDTNISNFFFFFNENSFLSEELNNHTVNFFLDWEIYIEILNRFCLKLKL